MKFLTVIFTKINKFLDDIAKRSEMDFSHMTEDEIFWFFYYMNNRD